MTLLQNTAEFFTRPPAPGVRRPALVAAVVSMSLMAAFETAKEALADGLFPEMTRWQSHGLTIAFSSAVAGFAALLVLRRQRDLHRQVAVESMERARLSEIRQNLVLRTAELEESSKALNQEIAERERISSALGQSEAINRAVLAALPDFLFRIGRDGFYRAAHIPERFAVAPDALEWVGHHVSERLPATVAVPALEQIRACLDTGKPQLLEFSLDTAEGPRSFEARYVPRGSDEVLGLVRDITDRVRLERDLVHAQKMESVGRLAGGVAHDFNNLLTAISAHVDFAAEALDDTHPAQEDLAGIRHASGLGAQLTRKLLSFARKQPVTARRVDVAALTRELEMVLRRTFGGAIEVEIKADADAMDTIADPGQIEQVIINLAVNARDAMPNGGHLTVQVQRDPHAPLDWMMLTVSDTGTGMDARIRDRIFEPFFTTKADGQGTGLGLSIVYGVVTRAGGTITVDSVVGKGSVFTVRLPIVTVDDAAPTLPATARPMAGTETILVAEDDPQVRQLAVRALRRYGYRVLVAMDGVQALDVALSSPSRVDLLLTDVLMPRMGGPEVAERLRRLHPGLPVVFVSGYTGGHGFGADETHVVGKPFAIEELVLAVRDALDAGRAA